MITRYNYKWQKPVIISEPIKEDYELVRIIEPVSFNEDKSIKEYKERFEYVVKQTKWADFIKSFDIGSISEQVMNHLTKGTPLVTGHTLPHGDYTPEAIEKGAKLKRELESKGITFDMLVSAYKEAQKSIDEPISENKESEDVK